MVNYKIDDYYKELSDKYEQIMSIAFSTIDLKLNYLIDLKEKEIFLIRKHTLPSEIEYRLSEILRVHKFYKNDIKNLDKLNDEFSNFVIDSKKYKELIETNNFTINFFIQDINYIYTEGNQIENKTASKLMSIYSKESNDCVKPAFDYINIELNKLQTLFYEGGVTSFDYNNEELKLPYVLDMIKKNFLNSIYTYNVRELYSFKGYDQTENKILNIKDFEQNYNKDNINIESKQDFSLDLELLRIKSTLIRMIRTERKIISIDAALNYLSSKEQHQINYIKTIDYLNEMKAIEQENLQELNKEFSHLKYNEIIQLLNDSDKQDINKMYL